MEWISVNDRLPEQVSFVLCYPNTKICLFGKLGDFGKERMFTSYNIDMEYWDNEASITHWMPLPEPPKTE